MCAEPTLADNLSESKVRVYSCTLNSLPVGYMESPEAEVTKVLKPIMLWGHHMGDRLISVAAKLTLPVRQIKKAALAKALPWYTWNGTDTFMPLQPTAFGGDMYDQAVACVLHPVDKGATADEDLYLLKVAVTGPLKFKGDGENDATFPLELTAYFDRQYLTQTPPRFVLGTIGAVFSIPA